MQISATSDNQLLAYLSTRLSNFSYVGGFLPTADDDLIFDRLTSLTTSSAFSDSPHILRYYRHIHSFSREERLLWGERQMPYTGITAALISSDKPSIKSEKQSEHNGLHKSDADDCQLSLNILQLLSSSTQCVNSLTLAKDWNFDHQKIVGAIKSLEALQMVITETRIESVVNVTSEGKHIASHGSHEAVLFHAVDPVQGSLHQMLLSNVPNSKLGFAKAISAKWVRLDKEAEGGARVFRIVKDIDDRVMRDMQLIANARTMESLFEQIDAKTRAEYKKRKLLTESTIKSINVVKGPNFATQIRKQDTDLTFELLTSGEWEQASFKEYNFNAMGMSLQCGHLHPLMKVRSEFREIFLEMGFSEMPTNQYIESSFWNFDALFQPQQHPARDAHDTFFISDPAECNSIPDFYVDAVRKVHSEGGYGSQGYKYNWQLCEAKKNLLRTHTTAISARMLYKLAQQKEFTPVKFFSIDRVFRNETLDATHLAEFHQVEGVIADRNVSLANLIGVLHQFFARLGITKLRFKPAYNPYTEPSMEIFAHHPGLGKWVEIGNSGVFRPEMLLPMQLPEDVNVIAWGLSLERPTMIKYGIKNIRDLFGPKVDLKMIYDNAICRIDKQ